MEKRRNIYKLQLLVRDGSFEHKLKEKGRPSKGQMFEDWDRKVSDDIIVFDYQQRCKEKGYLVLGYRHYKEGNLSEDKDKDMGFLESPTSISALEKFLEMKRGDLVLLRLRDSKFYLCEIEDNNVLTDQTAHRNRTLPDDVSVLEQSWGKTDPIDQLEPIRATYIRKARWYCLGDQFDQPGILQGSFINRQHTIQRLSQGRTAPQQDYSLLEKVVSLIYDYKVLNKKEPTEEDKTMLDNPQNNPNNNSFTVLSPYELEDLVYRYIAEKNPEYELLPSSCKLDTIMVEFCLYHKSDHSRRITCQVKNRARIEASKYTSLLPDYERIYLFSGVNSYGETAPVDPKIEYINPQQLYRIVWNEFRAEQGYFFEKLSQYYRVPDNL